MNQPQQMHAGVGPDGAPRWVQLGKRRHAITAVVDRWLVEDHWWRPGNIRQRLYHQLQLDDARVIVAFRDMTDNTWWLQHNRLQVHRDGMPMTPVATTVTDPATAYVELHLHSNYSLLEGASHIDELIQQAKAMGYTALALTDHDNLYGAMNWAQACRRYDVRAITGMELTYAEDPDEGVRYHLTLLARNRQGYVNLCRLATLAHGQALASQEDRERRRRDPCVRLTDIREHTAGLICLTGCRQGELSVLADSGTNSAAAAVAERWKQWFGTEDVYVELMDNLVQGDRPRNRRLARLAAAAGLRCAATGDVHYHDRDRRRLQDTLVSIHNNVTLDGGRRFHRPNGMFHLRSPDRQAQRFKEWPDAVRASFDIAERCTFDLTHDLGYRLPQPPVPAGRDVNAHLAEVCRTKLLQKYAADELPAATARLDEELRLIAMHDMAGYFLIYHEVLKLAEAVATEIRSGTPRANTTLPPGRGRGSSVSSIVCYLIGLSHIDPVRNNLFLGRFLNEEMVGLPDIDIDFPRDIRAQLFLRVYEHWGKDHAAIVGLFPTYRIRSAIRDIGKALGLPPHTLDRLASFSEGYGSAGEVKEEMQRLPLFASLVDAPGWSDLIELAAQIKGFPRHLSQHVGGMVISSEPLIDCVAVEPAAWPGRYICQWDKDSIDDARMVKIDFLGLGMLSLVEECIDNVAHNRGTIIDLSRIDFTDSRVYDRIGQADTIGVFQIESRAQAAMLPRTRPRNLEDLAAQVAIIRPGPIVGGALQHYVKGREMQRLQPEVMGQILHEKLRPILGETYGVVLYQEQVVRVAQELGGFTAGEAEAFRRAMGRRDWEITEPDYRERFVTGAARNGLPPDVIETLYTNIAGFAQFGFPKSHAVAFGLLAFQSAWLREYFAPEFYCALYNQWPMGFYAPHVVTNDALRHDVAIRRPSVNHSQVMCSVEGDSVRIGFKYVKGLGEETGRRLVTEREAGGPYRSLLDCAHRSQISRSSLDCLVQAGAFDDVNGNRRELLWQSGLIGDGVAASAKAATPRQLPLILPIEQDQVALKDFSAWQRMSSDYSVLHLSPDSHPLGLLRPQLDPRVLSVKEVMNRAVGSRIEVAGLVVCRQHPQTAKGTVFLAVEDETGLFNVVIPPALYERDRLVIRSSPMVCVQAQLEGFAGAVPMLRATAVTALNVAGGTLLPEPRSWR